MTSGLRVRGRSWGRWRRAFVVAPGGRFCANGTLGTAMRAGAEAATMGVSAVVVLGRTATSIPGTADYLRRRRSGRFWDVGTRATSTGTKRSPGRVEVEKLRVHG